jgi:hypothetical protein
MKPIPVPGPVHGIIKVANPANEGAMRDHLEEQTQHMKATADYGGHGLDATPRGELTAASGPTEYQTTSVEQQDADTGGNPA